MCYFNFFKKMATFNFWNLLFLQVIFLIKKLKLKLNLQHSFLIRILIIKGQIGEIEHTWVLECMLSCTPAFVCFSEILDLSHLLCR